jgi:hypothetical protein
MPKKETISLMETDSLNLALGTMMAIRHNYNAGLQKIAKRPNPFLEEGRMFSVVICLEKDIDALLFSLA